MSYQKTNKKIHQNRYYDSFLLTARFYNTFGPMSTPQNDVFLLKTAFQNPWWTRLFRKMKHNIYFDSFFKKVKEQT